MESTLYIRKPVAMISGLAADAVEKHFLEARRDGAAGPVADFSIIEFSNRRYFRGGTGKKSFIGAIYLVAGNTLLDHRNSNLSRQLYD